LRLWNTCAYGGERFKPHKLDSIMVLACLNHPLGLTCQTRNSLWSDCS